MKVIALGVAAPLGRHSSWLAVLLVLLTMAASPPTQAQGLTAQQLQKLNAVNSGLKRVGVNLELAISTAGPGTGVPKGSKAKLARMRLNSAAADLPQLRQWLAELPADQPSVQAVAADMQAIEQSITELEARLSGKGAAPSPSASQSPAPVPAAAQPKAEAESARTDAAPPAARAAESQEVSAVRLDYRQEEVLKGARFNLREVEGYAEALTRLVEELSAVADQLSVDHRRVQTGLNTVAAARRKAGFTQDALATLPPDGQGVAETAQRLAAAEAKIEAAEAYLEPLQRELAALIDPANYPDFQADLKRLRELSVMYGDPMLLQTNRSQAAAVLAEASAAKQEVVRMASKYRRLMEQQTEEGKRIEGAGNSFLQKQNQFLAAADQQKQTLPQQIRADLAEADAIANEAVAERKPLFFTGGIPQLMGFAEDKLALYKVLDPAGAGALEQEMAQLQASLAEREKSLGELIIQQNPLPADRYTGADRDKILAVAVDAWKHQEPEFTLLASRIPSEAWARETMWQYSNGTWYYVDRSKLQVVLLVADPKDAKLAVMRPVNIWMNHQKGDSLIGTPLYSADDALQPSAYLLRNKIN